MLVENVSQLCDLKTINQWFRFNDDLCNPIYSLTVRNRADKFYSHRNNKNTLSCTVNEDSQAQTRGPIARTATFSL